MSAARESILSAVRDALAEHRPADMPSLPGRTNHIECGVLVPLELRRDEEAESVAAVLTVRAAHLRRNPGEVCFPGGRREVGDRSLEETALREAREELGCAASKVLGRLSSIPLFTSDDRLCPFVAHLDGGELCINEDEVADVVRIDVHTVLQQPHIEGLAFEVAGHSGLSPIFRADGRIVFGATAHVFHELLTVVAPCFDKPVPPIVESKLTWAHVLPPRFARVMDPS